MKDRPKQNGNKIPRIHDKKTLSKPKQNWSEKVKVILLLVFRKILPIKVGNVAVVKMRIMEPFCLEKW